MTLESVFFITQIFAAIAVTASLFYVSHEVRHNTKALKLATYQSVVNSSMKILHSLYSSNETASFYHRCLFNNAELSGPEKLRWHAVMITIYRHWDNLFFFFFCSPKKRNKKKAPEKDYIPFSGWFPD